ncbi:MAG: hypothetical protein ABSC72_00755 [Methylovirgula sp.]|jgi:hypothetical protein
MIVTVHQGMGMMMAVDHDDGMMMALVMMVIGVRNGRAQQAERDCDQQYLSNFHEFSPGPKRQIQMKRSRIGDCRTKATLEARKRCRFLKFALQVGEPLLPRNRALAKKTTARLG